MINRNSKRMNLRVKPDMPLYAYMAIDSVRMDKVKSGNSVVRIYDIGIGGLRFLSDLNFPTGDFFKLRFTFYSIESQLQLIGYIVHKKNLRLGMYQYGVCFEEIDRSTRSRLISLFNIIASSVDKKKIMWKLN